MDPYNEQRLKEEVIFLHSLWAQGPPRTNPNPNPNPNVPTYLRPTPSHFKKQGKDKRNKDRQHANRPLASDRAPVSDIEWPCLPPPEPKPETYTAWPVLNLPSAKKTRSPSAGEQARFIADRVQRKALKVAKEFFGSSGDSDDDDSEDEDDDAMEEDESEEYRLLMRIFIQDREFRAYYEKNYGNGEFCCLVCGGIGQKIGKRFKDCVALVQHSISIAKTKKKRAHRAYGLAICKVLGWDIKRLPTIVSSLAKPGDSQANVDDGNKENSNNVRDNVDFVTVDNGVGETLPEKAVDFPNGGDGELMICENSQTEDLEQRVPNADEGNADGVVNHLQPLKDDAIGSDGNEIKDDQKDSAVVDSLKEGDENQI